MTVKDAPTILVVEDSEDVRVLLSAWLRGRGCRVVEAGDGQEAVETARRECPDLILMDMSLPSLDGISAVQRILEIEEMCDVPILACSAHDAEDWAKKALAAGCREYVSKPFNFVTLSQTLERYIPLWGNKT